MFKDQTSLLEIWHPYWLWECFKNGMWDRRKKDMSIIKKCAALLSDPDLCRASMVDALNSYPISAEQHLTKPTGRNPWIGQAACCSALKATEEETRIAWNFYMTQDQQDSANRIADDVISEWERGNV
jgi:hypothetical protein